MTSVSMGSDVPAGPRVCKAYPLDENPTVNDSHQLAPVGPKATIPESLAHLIRQIGRATSAASSLPPHLLGGISLASKMSSATVAGGMFGPASPR